MSEETKEVVVEETVVVEADPVENQAREQGWVSREEWVAAGKPETDHRSAKEFVERGELYKSIHTTKRELKQTQAALQALQKHHQYIFDKAYQTAKRDLQLQRRSAMREGDFEAVEELEQKMEELNTQHVQEKQALVQSTAQAGPPPEFVEFIDRNPWYMQDNQLRREADKEAFAYLNHDGGDPKQLLQHVEKTIKQKFPEKFGIKRAAPNAVAGVDRTASGRVTKDIQLDALEEKIMRDLVATGEMTEAQYKAELKRAKGIK